MYPTNPLLPRRTPVEPTTNGRPTQSAVTPRRCASSLKRTIVPRTWPQRRSPLSWLLRYGEWRVRLKQKKNMSFKPACLTEKLHTVSRKIWIKKNKEKKGWAGKGFLSIRYPTDSRYFENRISDILPNSAFFIEKKNRLNKSR